MHRGRGPAKQIGAVGRVRTGSSGDSKPQKIRQSRWEYSRGLSHDPRDSEAHPQVRLDCGRDVASSSSSGAPVALVFFHTHRRQSPKVVRPQAKNPKEQQLHTRKQRTKHITSYSKSDIASSQFQSIWQAINIPSHKKLNSWLSTVQDPQHTSRFFDRSLDKACTVQVTLAPCSNILTTKIEPPDTASLEKS